MIVTSALFLFTVFTTSPSEAVQQPINLEDITKQLDAKGQVALTQFDITLPRFDYPCAGDTVEAITFRPSKEGRYPGVLLIPGFSRSARDYIPMGIRLAREGIASVAVTQRGFGKSTGKPDFVGPKTIQSLDAGFQKFAKEPYVDTKRLGVFGYSRGAMAASLLAVNRSDLKAAVFAAGIYDLRQAYDEIKFAAIRENMEQEAGLSPEAVAARSSLTKMGKLDCPVLILHGEKDENAPVTQAKELAKKLKSLGKEHELKLFPDRDHDLGRQNLNDATIAFFKKKLFEQK